VLILDHHLMRSEEGGVWLDTLSATLARLRRFDPDFHEFRPFKRTKPLIIKESDSQNPL
jgi:hypothetical protein